MGIQTLSAVRPVAGLLAVLALAGCGSATGSTEGSSATDGGSDSDELPAVFAKFRSSNAYGSTVSVYLDGDAVVIETNGIPNHGSPYFPVGDSRYESYSGANTFQQNPNRIGDQDLVFRIPLNPAVDAAHPATPLGPIGVALNGVPFYNQYAGPNQPLTSEIASFDQYGGHPQQSDQYHYHVEPVWLTGTDGRDALVGFLLDGFPVYAPEENGAAVAESSLDAYHGHFGVTVDYPDGIYHYHVTAQDPYINGSGFYGTPGTVSQ